MRLWPAPGVMGVLAVLLAVLGLALFDSPLWGDEPNPAAAETSTTSRSPRVTIDDCRTWFPYRRRLASERAGILAETPEEGTRFEPGAVVARLSDHVPRTALNVARKKAANDADVRQATKAHELAKFSFDRMQAANTARPGTFDADEVRQRELDTASSALRIDVAQHQFEVSQLEVEQSQAELDTFGIRTDRGGLVTRVIKHDGEGVQLGEEVLEIVDTSVVRVEGYASGRFLSLLKPGLPVAVVVYTPSEEEPRGREHRLAGKLGFVDVRLTSGGELRVWVDVANPEGQLIEGLTGKLLVE